MKDKKDIQYKILKSEACGHTIEYKMVKKEHELEKARIDEGLSPREKMKAREARSSKEREPRELSPEQYETAKKIARTKSVTETGEKQRKQTFKDALHTHKQNIPKSPSKEDLEYPMAASEEECKCEDKTEKCECEDKEMKKREKFYIQKIQKLRKAVPRYVENPEDVARGKVLNEQRRNQAIESRLSDKTPSTPSSFFQERSDLARQQMGNRFGIKENSSQSPMSGTKSNSGEYVMRNAPQGTERANQGMLNNMTGFLPKQTPVAETSASTAQSKQATTPGNIGVNPSMPDYNKLAVDSEDVAAPTSKAPQSFGEAFKAARAARMGGTGRDTFDFGGKQYHSFTKDDFAQGIGNNYNPELKQQQKSIKSSPAIPNTENAPSTNPMKPADQGSTKLKPEPLSLEQQQKQFS